MVVVPQKTVKIRDIKSKAEALRTEMRDMLEQGVGENYYKAPQADDLRKISSDLQEPFLYIDHHPVRLFELAQLTSIPASYEALSMDYARLSGEPRIHAQAKALSETCLKMKERVEQSGLIDDVNQYLAQERVALQQKHVSKLSR